jgi:hypothetical protein
LQGIKGSCLDSKCINKGTMHCEGNRISIERQEDDSKRVHLHLPHHKNERHTNNPMASGPIKVTLPDELSRLFIHHLEARHILWGTAAGAHEYVFCSAGGRGAHNPQHMDTESTSGSGALDTLFNGLLSRSPPIIRNFKDPKLTPTLLRTCFIEAATERVDEADWESLALAMGNSVGTWLKHYAVTLKSRKIQKGVDRFQHLMKLSGRSLVSNSLGGASTSNSQGLVPHPMDRAHIPSVLLTIYDEDDNSSGVGVGVGAGACGDSVFDGNKCWRGWECLGPGF